MSVWDDISGAVDDPSALGRLEPLLDRLDDDGMPGTADDPVDDPDPGPSGTHWRRWERILAGDRPLEIVPGRSAAGAASPDDGVLVLTDGVTVQVDLEYDGPPATSATTGGIRVTVIAPGLVFRPPGLVPARLDSRGQLEPDTGREHVEFHLPRLRIRIERPADGAFSTRLLGPATDPDDPGPERLYEFIRMEPPYALSGPDATFGFAFRSAVLDMSETDTPSSGVADGIALPAAWQGLWLPEARIFVSPNGLEGIAVSAGVRDLYVGIGEHEGLSGEFQVEVVNRGSAPELHLRIQTATGELIAVPAGDTATAQAPPGSTVVADASGGLAPHTYALVVGAAAPVAGDRAPLGDLGAPATVEARVSDAEGHATTRTVTVSRRTSGPPGTGGAPPTTNPAVLERPPGQAVVVALARQTADAVVLHAPAAHGSLTWAVAGVDTTTGPDGELTIPLGPGATATVEVTETLAATSVLEHCYFTFEKPEASDTQGTRLAVYHQNPANTSREPQVGQRGALGPPWFRTGAAERFQRDPGAAWTVDGFASYETRPEKAEYNRRLSRRRMDVLEAILAELGVTVARGTAHGHDRAAAAVPGEPEPGSGEWRRATARALVSATQQGVVTLRRPPAPAPAPAPDTDPAPVPRGRPDCFRRIGVRVRVVEDVFTRLEVYGDFDIETAAEGRLPESSNDLPGNPSDGIVGFLVGLELAADRTSWEVRAEFHSADEDLDGLVRWSDSDGDDTALNMVGGLAIMAPLMAVATPSTPDDGADLVPMALIGAAGAVLGAAEVLRTHSLILRGAEVVVADTPISATDVHGPTRTTVTLLFDVEAAFSLDAGIITIDPREPVTTRYRAVGVRAGWDEVDDGTGGIDYVPVPVFDSSRGYTLDIPAGSMSAQPPLDDLLRILGVQVSRSNPAFLEIEVGMGVDLGIITVESARARIKLATPTSIELTKLAASIEIPGTLHGSGYVSINPDGFSGGLDLTLTSINLRASATVTVRKSEHGFTGVLVGAEVEFPVPLVLGSSGLGIFGFSGGVAINHTRNSGTEPTAALEWVHSQLAGANGSIMRPEGWSLEADTFAVAAGMLVGTLEGGFLLHLKGMLLVEVPGPRLLLIMKADVVKAPPALGSSQSATFLAVLDLDFERGTITIGIVAAYEIEKILQVRVPVTAFFPTRGESDQWFVDLGSLDDPVRVAILDVFEGTGYLMIHGAGLTHPTLDVTTTGLTIATGFHLRAVLMGSESAGLYLLVAAGFDAIMAFEPVFIAGRIYVSGELRLFIVSIGASAELVVRVGQESLESPAQTTYVHGEVCGKVDFFFFSVKGCVSLTIGHEPELPPPPDLLSGVTLVARGPVVLEGDGTEQVIDGTLAVGVQDPSAAGEGDRVPIDAIPVVELTATPVVASDATVLGEPAPPSSALSTGGWVRRGDLWVRYRVTDITLREHQPDGTSSVFDPAGERTPCSWWTRTPAQPDRADPLALLSWVPFHTPHALPYGETMLDEVRREWDVCTPPPPPAETLWTFDDQPLGPEPAGWRLRGLGWPDPPGTSRGHRTRVDVHVTEPWRTSHPVADLLAVTPARVVGDHVACPTREPLRPGLAEWDDGSPPSRAAGLHGPAGHEALAEALEGGSSLLDAGASVAEKGWDPLENPEAGGCRGRILQSPLGHDETPPKAGPAGDRELVERAWSETGHEPHALRNAVRLTPTSPLSRASLLLLVDVRQLRAEALQVERRTARGEPIDRTVVTSAHRVDFGASLPASWWDPVLGPWAEPVQRAGRVAARIAGSFRSRDQHEYALVFVELPDARPAAHLDLGWDRGAPAGERPFYVIAVSGLSRTERERHQRQSDYQAARRSVAATTITQDESDHALLRPGRRYSVEVSWESQRVEQEAEPVDPGLAWEAASAPSVRSFWTVEADEHPRDLAPWLLATAPSDREHGVLCTQPVRLALATQSVVRLFDAYDRELRVQVRAASGAHPPPPGGAPGDAVRIPLGPGGPRRPLRPDTEIRSGFHEALREVLDELPCIDPGPAPDREEIFIPYELDPLTEYIIDVFAPHRSAASVSDDDRIHRIQFTTSRFDAVDEIAGLVADGPVESVAVADPAPLLALPERPAGPELDDAFVRAGLDLPGVPRFPRTQVLWGERAGAAEPVAVVIESGETLWRHRVQPVQRAAGADSEDPRHRWWSRQPVPWLGVAHTGDAEVLRVVRGPGDTRAVVLLRPGQRDRTLALDLVLAASGFWDTPEQRASLGVHRFVRPEWEVED